MTSAKFDKLQRYIDEEVLPIMKAQAEAIDAHEELIRKMSEVVEHLDAALTQLEARVNEPPKRKASSQASAHASGEASGEAASSDQPKKKKKKLVVLVEQEPGKPSDSCGLCERPLNNNPLKHWTTKLHTGKLAATPMYCPLDCSRKCRGTWSSECPVAVSFDEKSMAQTESCTLCRFCGGLVELKEN